MGHHKLTVTFGYQKFSMLQSIWNKYEMEEGEIAWLRIEMKPEK